MNAPTPPVAPAAPINTGLTGAGSNLAKVLNAGQFAVCVEVSPPVGPNVEAIQREIKTLKGYGDAYNVTDNQSAMVHVSSLAVSIMLKQAGMEPVIQFTARDRNRLGIQGDLLGGAVFGINTILCLSGDHPIWGDHPQCKPVYDMDSLNLIRMARMMRNNQVFENGKLIPKIAPDFFIGAVENPFAPPYDYRPLRLAKKIVAGAQFIQTQLIFIVDRFREFMKRWSIWVCTRRSPSWPASADPLQQGGRVHEERSRRHGCARLGAQAAGGAVEGGSAKGGP